MYVMCGQCPHITIPGSAEDNLNTVWEKIQEFYAMNPGVHAGRYGHLQLSMICNETEPMKRFPKLKGKAAEVKHLVPALLHAWAFFMDDSSDRHNMILLGLQMSSRIDEILEASKGEFALKGDTLVQYQMAIFIFLNAQNALGTWYPDEGLKLFDITYKSHALGHSALQAEWINPVLSWCFKGEDFMQKVRKISTNCSKGTALHKVGQAVLEKWCTGMWFNLLPASKWWSG